MNIQKLYDFCLAKQAVTESFPFDNETLVFKVAGKMFCLTSLKGWEEGTPSLNLKCDPERALELRAEYEAIVPGFHMSKTHWNTVRLGQDVTDKMVFELIKHSYEQVVKGLPKKLKSTLNI